MEEVSSVIVAIGGLPWWAVLVILVVFCFFAVVILAAVVWNGFNLKFAKFDGLKKISKTNETERQTLDIMRKELPRTADLTRTAEAIDRETKGDIIDALHSLILELWEANRHSGCSFIGDSVKTELRLIMKNYINKNHIVYKCYPQNIEGEKRKLIAEIKERYKIALLKMEGVKCDGNADALPNWEEAKASVRTFLDDFFEAMKKTIIKGCRRKIEAYEYARSSFSADWIIAGYIDKPIEENKGYIEKLS